MTTTPTPTPTLSAAPVPAPTPAFTWPWRDLAGAYGECVKLTNAEGDRLELRAFYTLQGSVRLRITLQVGMQSEDGPAEGTVLVSLPADSLGAAKLKAEGHATRILDSLDLLQSFKAAL